MNEEITISKQPPSPPKVVMTPKSAIPRKSSITTGKKILDYLSEVKEGRIHTDVKKNQMYMKQMLYTFSIGSFVATQVLSILNKQYPQYRTSVNAVEDTENALRNLRSETVKKKRVNLVDSICKSRIYSSVIDACAGHSDVYSKKSSGFEMENKMTLCFGNADTSIKMTKFVREGKVPPGFLGYPQFKVATVCYAMDEMEVHDLASQQIMHSATCVDRPKNYSRGSWTYNAKKKEHTFYPQGMAICDLR